MALFVVITPDKGEGIEAALKAQFSNDFYPLNETAFVVSASLTSRQLCDKLGISVPSPDTMGPNAPAAVFKLTKSYWGIYPAGLWEWIQLKIEGADA